MRRVHRGRADQYANFCIMPKVDSINDTHTKQFPGSSCETPQQRQMRRSHKRTSQGDHILEGRTGNPYLSHIDVKRVNRAYLLEMVKVRRRKQTKGRTGKEDDGEGDPAGDCAGSTRGEEKGIGRKRERPWGTMEAEGGEEEGKEASARASPASP